MAHTHYYLNRDSGFDIQINPTLLYTGCVKDDPDWISEAHLHDFCEILYVQDGTGSIETAFNSSEVRHYDIHPGDLIIFNPGVTHAERSDPKHPLNLVFLAVMDFQIGDLPKNCLIENDTKPVISSRKYRYKIESYFSDLILETDKRIEFHRSMSSNLVCSLMVLILRLLITQDAKQELSEECRKIKQYIDENYTANITLESLSETIYISKHHLSHLFKNQTGISPIKYLIARRIEEACRLLSETDYSIAKIAQKVGYNDAVYFSQIFKKTKGIAPLNYRNTTRK